MFEKDMSDFIRKIFSSFYVSLSHYELTLFVRSIRWLNLFTLIDIVIYGLSLNLHRNPLVTGFFS
jgi:hypothetical protein